MTKETPQSNMNKPCLVSLTKGKRFAWCQCGKSQSQPFCDGSHKGTSFEPIVFTAEDTKDYLLCGCKQTKSPPFCDGSHNNIDDSYELASDAEIAATKDAENIARDHGAYGKSALDGGAFVLSPPPADLSHHDAFSWQSLITPLDGAQKLNLLAIEAKQTTPWRAHHGGDTILYILSGEAAIHIEGAIFTAGPETGVYVRKGEKFRIDPKGRAHILAAISPDLEPASSTEEPLEEISTEVHHRCVSVDPSARQKMADRFYQVLIDNEVGSDEMTQFIGEVPKSRAAFHRHLYEEAIVILSGDGVMWTRNRKTDVKPGDIIYLPARQEHSLECSSDEGLRLMGVFYPSGSPAINY